MDNGAKRHCYKIITGYPRKQADIISIIPVEMGVIRLS